MKGTPSRHSWQVQHLKSILTIRVYFLLSSQHSSRHATSGLLKSGNLCFGKLKTMQSLGGLQLNGFTSKRSNFPLHNKLQHIHQPEASRMVGFPHSLENSLHDWMLTQSTLVRDMMKSRIKVVLFTINLSADVIKSFPSAMKGIEELSRVISISTCTWTLFMPWCTKSALTSNTWVSCRTSGKWSRMCGRDFPSPDTPPRLQSRVDCTRNSFRKTLKIQFWNFERELLPRCWVGTKTDHSLLF